MTRLNLGKAPDAVSMKSKEGLLPLVYTDGIIPSDSSLGFINNNLLTEDESIDYLAQILVEIFLDQKKHYAKSSKQQSSDILSSVL